MEDPYNEQTTFSTGSLCLCSAGTDLMGKACVDRDECSDDTVRCSSKANTECRNTFGSFECVCKLGFYKDASGNCLGEFCRQMNKGAS